MSRPTLGVSLRILAVLIIGLALTTSADAGLMAHWTFEEGSGSTTADASGNGWTGTLEGDPTWIDTGLAPVPASSGGTSWAIAFDGTGDVVSTNGLPGIGGADDRTVAFWVRTTDTGDNGLVAWGDEAENGQKYHIRVNNDATGGRVLGAVRTEAQGGNLTGTTNIADGNWHHVVSTFSGTNNTDVRHWVDGGLERVSAAVGVAVDTDIDASDSDTNEKPVTVAGRSQTGMKYLAGAMDDVRLYDHVLTPLAIKQLAGAAMDPYETQVLTDTPVAYWRLNESAASQAALSEGTLAAVDGTYQNTPAVGQASLVPDVAANAAVAFDAAQSQFIAIPDSAINTSSNIPQRTVELWFNADDPTGRQVLFEEGGTTTGLNLYLEGGDVVVGAWRGRGTNQFAKFISAPVVAGETNHLVLVLDGAGSTMTGYLNGSPVGQAGGVGYLDGHADDVGIAAQSVSSKYISGNDTAATAYFFAGTLDEVSVYNEALSVARVRAHLLGGDAGADAYGRMVLADAPIAYWQLSETDDTRNLAVNLATPQTTPGGVGLGDAVTSTYTGGVTQRAGTLIPDARNDAAAFDGADDRVVVPNHPEINSSGTEAQRTIELWFNADAVTDRQVLFEEGGSGNGMAVYVEADTLYAGAWNTNGTGMFKYLSAPVTAGETHHVVLSFDDTTDLMAGLLDGAWFGAAKNIAPLNVHTGKIAIGGMEDACRFVATGSPGEGASGNGYYFAGTIDDVALYNAGLDGRQVQSHYVAATGDWRGITHDATAWDPTLGVMLNYDAAGAVGSADWQDSIGTLAKSGASTDLGWSLTNANLLTTGVSGHPGITAAFDFSGAGSGGSHPGGGSLDSWQEVLPNAGYDARSATFELWFKPEALSGKAVLFETGGNVDGTAIRLNGDLVEFATQDSSGPTLAFDLDLGDDGIDSGDFIQVVGVVDFEADEVLLYVNGYLKAVQTGYTGVDWSGSDGAALGKVVGTVAGANNGAFTSTVFDGQIAVFRFYPKALTEGQVARNYIAIVPEPATLAFLGLGVGGMLLRRRWA